MKIILLLFSLLFFFDLPGLAATEIPLSLSEAIRRALLNNPEIQIEKENIRIREAAELLEQSRFDGQLHFNGGVRRSTQRAVSLLETSVIPQARIDRHDIEWDLGWKRPFPWGGEYNLTLTTRQTDSTFQTQNPTVTGDLVLVITQPLLKGRGYRIRQTPRIFAETDTAIAHRIFDARVTDIVQKIVSLYWDLVYQRENLKVQQSSLGWAQKLLERNQTQVALGVLAPIEILVAEVSVASREEGVIVAQKGVGDVHEQLRNMIEGPLASDLSVQIVPIDRPVEEAIPYAPDLIERALRERPEVEAQELKIQNSALSVNIARDQGRLALDFVGLIGPSGAGKDFHDPFDQFSSGDFYRWEAGLVLTYPFGNRAGAAAWAKAQAEQNKARLEQAQRISQIQLEVTEGQRRATTNFQRIVATRRALELAQKQHTAGEERYRLGLLSSHDLILFQNEVAIHAGNALRAVIDYNKSLTNLYAVTGGLLSHYGIKTAPSSED